ncbi:hypothetical protein GGR54DRAFT_650905 [Hypoxylon sp. NC1633]|nr:hypothetical protein GGR54DRAFT_650905 [Hypoxylon sp. NC1633]
MTTTMATVQEPSLFDSLPNETIVRIFASLTSLKSILALSLTARRFHAILSNHEGQVAYGYAIGLVGDDDPDVVKYAFMASEAVCIRGLISSHNYESGHSDFTDRVDEILDKFVRKGKWPQRLYRLRALPMIAIISEGVEIVMDWVASYGMLWPLKLEKTDFTATEVTRQRRIWYLIETAYLLFDLVFNENVQSQMLRFWKTFSLYEIDAALQLIWIVGETIDHSKRQTLFPGRIRLAWSYHRLLNIWVAPYFVFKDHTFHQRHPLFQAMNAYLGRVPTSTDCNMTSLALYFDPFVDDPAILHTQTARNRRGWGVESRWGMTELFYSPQVFNQSIERDWFFMIGDEDRCRSVIEQGPCWSWSQAPEEVPVDSTSWDRAKDAKIVWHDDPTLFGFQGSAGIPVSLEDLAETNNNQS